MAVLLLLMTAMACGNSKPRLEVSGAITAAIAFAALGDDVDVITVGDEPVFDDAILGQLAPIPFGQGAQWTASPTASPDSPALGAPDPAVWLDPDRVVQAARLLADRVRLGDDARERTNLRIDELRDSMRDADEQVQALVAALPTEHQTIPTASIRLGYLTERYGLRISPPAAARAMSGPDPLAGLDTDRLGPAGSPTATLDGLIVEVARRVSSTLG